MNEPLASEGSPDNPSRDDVQSALFAQLVIQQANMALMLLGKVAHPETGQVIKDIEAARLFIDQLEMLEAKTKGNLNPDEARLLKQSLMSLRLAFVEAVESPPPKTEPAPPTAAQPAKTHETAPAPGPAPAAPEESHKKFSKKY
jgi:hypothetical protein